MSPAGPRLQILQSVDHALTVLEAFTPQRPEVTVIELSRSLGLERSTIYRLLVTLQAHNMIERTDVAGRYRLGLRAFEIGMLAVQHMGLGLQIQPVLEAVARECNETVNVGVLDGTDVLYVNKVVSKQILRMDSQIGRRVPAYCTAMGKLLLAYLPPEVLLRTLEAMSFERLTMHTVADAGELKKQLLRVRELGYSFDNQELAEGIRCVAVPIRNRFDQVIAALSVSAPSVRFDKPKVAAFVQLARAAAEQISAQIGHIDSQFALSSPSSTSLWGRS
jgi:DNA-binding IclR family transcriptional regulator